jgi:hypothetical protein
MCSYRECDNTTQREYVDWSGGESEEKLIVKWNRAEGIIR